MRRNPQLPWRGREWLLEPVRNHRLEFVAHPADPIGGPSEHQTMGPSASDAVCCSPSGSGCTMPSALSLRMLEAVQRRDS